MIEQYAPNIISSRKLGHQIIIVNQIR